MACHDPRSQVRWTRLGNSEFGNRVGTGRNSEFQRVRVKTSLTNGVWDDKVCGNNGETDGLTNHDSPNSKGRVFHVMVLCATVWNADKKKQSLEEYVKNPSSAKWDTIEQYGSLPGVFIHEMFHAFYQCKSMPSYLLVSVPVFGRQNSIGQL